jgi:hypothetical protein
MELNKTKLSTVQVKEQFQKNEAISGVRTDKSLNAKERLIFKDMYPMHSNKEVAVKFKISTEDVERLAHEMKVYKDPTYTRSITMETKEGSEWKHPSLQPGSAPSYLIDAITAKLTEEERREAMILYKEGINPIDMMHELAVVQRIRIRKGIKYEDDNEGLFKVMNDAIDSYHGILVDIDRMENGQATNNVITIDQYIMQQQGIEEKK